MRKSATIYLKTTPYSDNSVNCLTIQTPPPDSQKIPSTHLSRFFVVILHKNKKMLFLNCRNAKNSQKRPTPETPYFQGFQELSDNFVNNLTVYAGFMQVLCKFCIVPQTPCLQGFQAFCVIFCAIFSAYLCNMVW